MQTINKKSMLVIAMLLSVSTFLLSFSPMPGGESYKIYINKKLVVEQFVSNARKETFVSLNQSNLNDKIDIYYNHCGQVGKDRRVLIMNEHNKLVKDWRFNDVSGSNSMMTINAKDIIALQKDGKKLQLFYFSKELPGGKLLAKIVEGSNATIAKL